MGYKIPYGHPVTVAINVKGLDGNSGWRSIRVVGDEEPFEMVGNWNDAPTSDTVLDDNK